MNTPEINIWDIGKRIVLFPSGNFSNDTFKAGLNALVCSNEAETALKDFLTAFFQQRIQNSPCPNYIPEDIRALRESFEKMKIKYKGGLPFLTDRVPIALLSSGHDVSIDHARFHYDKDIPEIEIRNSTQEIPWTSKNPIRIMTQEAYLVSVIEVIFRDLESPAYIVAEKWDAVEKIISKK